VGYLKRKLSRARCKAAVGAGSRRNLADDLPSTKGNAKAAQPWLLRFVTDECDPDAGSHAGVFGIAYRVCDDLDVDATLRGQVRVELDWFEAHLPAFNPKNYAALFFFRSDAGECTRRVWELARLLTEAGRTVALRKVRSPGRIVYEDEYQVVAVPSGSLRRAGRV
jgi:hypothetical protein